MEQLRIPYTSVHLGEVSLEKEMSPKQMVDFKAKLAELGFELLDDHRKKLIEKIKNIIIGHVHYREEEKPYNLSEVLSSALHKDYSYLSNLFSEVEGTTIEKYFINQKIERAKELLVYGELSLSEIAFQLGYSSVAHLSAQFKKVTGLTPSHFKSLRVKLRKPLDKI